MIKHLRIDNRLIHGQVAVTWMNSIGAEVIIVVNDKVASDQLQKMALPLAARGSKVLVFTIAEMIQYEKDNINQTKLVIAKTPSDALELLKSGLEIEAVNVGNAAPIAGTDYKLVTNSIFATAEDAAVYREIAEIRGGKLTSRMTPFTDEIDFLAALKSAKL